MSARRSQGRRSPVPGGGASGAILRSPGASDRARRARRGGRLAGLLRFVVFLLLIFVAVWAGVRVANATVESAAFDGRPYQVQAGDTLWQIAVEQYAPRHDPRAVVAAIREANRLDGALLQPGQSLILPHLEE